MCVFLTITFLMTLRPGKSHVNFLETGQRSHQSVQVCCCHSAWGGGGGGGGGGVFKYDMHAIMAEVCYPDDSFTR